MPTYEYRCTECGERTEAFQRMSDAPLTTCPACHKEGLQRLVSGGAGVLYKGEGWYVTDYSKKSTGGKETPSTAKTESPAGTSTSESSSPSNSTDAGAKSSGSSDSSSTPLPKTGT